MEHVVVALVVEGQIVHRTWGVTLEVAKGALARDCGTSHLEDPGAFRHVENQGVCNCPHPEHHDTLRHQR